MPQKSADAFRTISEVADWLDTPAHVLRFWESKFSQIKPVKRAGGRRYYRPADMQLLGGIKKLLHDDGMTIKGAQKLLRENGIRYVAALSPPLEDELEQFVSHPAPSAPAPPMEIPRALIRSAEPAEPETADVLPFSARSAPTGEEELDTALREESAAEPPAPSGAPQSDAPEVDVAPADADPEAAEAPSEPAAAQEASTLSEPLATSVAEPLAEPEPEFSWDAPAEPDDAKALAPEAPESTGAEAETAKVAAVDVPADITESDVTPAASVLSKLADAPDVTQQRTTLRPLVAQLSALKDKMSAARRS